MTHHYLARGLEHDLVRHRGVPASMLAHLRIGAWSHASGNSLLHGDTTRCPRQTSSNKRNGKKPTRRTFRRIDVNSERWCCAPRLRSDTDEGQLVCALAALAEADRTVSAVARQSTRSLSDAATLLRRSSEVEAARTLVLAQPHGVDDDARTWLEDLTRRVADGVRSTRSWLDTHPDASLDEASRHTLANFYVLADAHPDRWTALRAAPGNRSRDHYADGVETVLCDIFEAHTEGVLTTRSQAQQMIGNYLDGATPCYLEQLPTAAFSAAPGRLGDIVTDLWRTAARDDAADLIDTWWDAKEAILAQRSPRLAFLPGTEPSGDGEVGLLYSVPAPQVDGDCRLAIVAEAVLPLLSAARDLPVGAPLPLGYPTDIADVTEDHLSALQDSTYVRLIHSLSIEMELEQVPAAALAVLSET